MNNTQNNQQNPTRAGEAKSEDPLIHFASWFQDAEQAKNTHAQRHDPRNRQPAGQTLSAGGFAQRG